MELKKLDMDDIKRRILYGLIILSLLPLITMFYINLKQDKWDFAILWLPICLDLFLTVDSATKNTVICFEQMFVIVAWIGPFNRIGIILSIITILCLLFFPYKRNPFYDQKSPSSIGRR